MSATMPDSPAPFSAVTAAHATPEVTAVVAAARSLPDLVNKLQTVDPALASQLEGKPLAASKAPIGTFIVPAIVWASTRWGLGWDETTCTLVAGVLVLIGTYVMRYISASPIAGIFTKAASPAQQAAVPVMAKVTPP